METDLFGNPIAPATRYAPGTRDTPRPWTEADDLLLFPVLAACRSERAYLAVCRELCSLLDRLPRLPGRPLPSALALEAVSLLERRTVTHSLGNAAPNRLAVLLYDAANTGEPLTWGDVRISRAWAAKPADERCEFDVLMGLLGRGSGDDARVRACLVGGGRSWPEQPEFPAPRCAAEVVQFRSDPNPQTWAALQGAARHPGSE